VSTHFNGRNGLIIVTAHVWGPNGDIYMTLALDTGATTTLLDRETLRELGYQVDIPEHTIHLITCSGVEFVPAVTLARISALGKERTSALVAAHTLPSSTPVDGLLGLDFLLESNLEIDFRSGKITLR
jgi:predicted aspartyl protease